MQLFKYPPLENHDLFLEHNVIHAMYTFAQDVARILTKSGQITIEGKDLSTTTSFWHSSLQKQDVQEM